MKHTIKDVARMANVSIATVSRILNNQSGYSEETKQKVLEIINEIGYEPNAVARGLVSKRTRTIGLLVPDLTSTFATELLKGVEKGANARGNSVIFCHTEFEGVKTMKYLQLLNEKQIDGIIYASNELEDEYYQYIKNMNVPLVLLATQADQYPVPFVKVNDRAAAFTATEYLIKKGHRKIAMISGGQEDLIAGYPRLDGYMAALRSHNIPINESLIEKRGFFFQDGYDGFQALIEREPDITAIFAGSDDIALGILSAAYHMGIKIPDKISVIGYDNLKVAEMAIPPLTTVAQPLAEMGEKAASMIFKMIESNQNVSSVYLPFEIVERKSVADITGN